MLSSFSSRCSIVCRSLLGNLGNNVSGAMRTSDGVMSGLSGGNLFFQRLYSMMPGLAGANSQKSLNFVQSILEEDAQFSQRKKADIVHVLMRKKKTFVTVTDFKGNKKLGGSGGWLQEKGKGRSRYAAEATAELVGRNARKIGLNSVVIKVKGFTYFGKKRKAILSWKEGFKGEGVGGRSRILAIHDVTQLPHNGCRRRKKRRI